MTDVMCTNCKKIMRKKGTLIMSNSKYEVYICPACGADKKICVGVLK